MAPSTPITGQYRFSFLMLAQGKTGRWWLVWRRKGRRDMMSVRLG